MEIKFAKLKNNAIIPSKRDEDGCFDIYGVITNDIVIEPHKIAMIPTGLCSAFSKRYRIGFRERGSNTKSGLKVNAGQIDSGYRGEWFVSLYNSNNNTVIITNTVKEVTIISDTILVPITKALAQFAIEKVPKTKVVETSIDDILKIKSERGLGKLGSSKK